MLLISRSDQVSHEKDRGGELWSMAKGSRNAGRLGLRTQSHIEARFRADFLKILVQVDIDPAAEETKGGAGHVAKALFSYGPDRVGVVCYVPKELQVCTRQLGLERRVGACEMSTIPRIRDA